MNVAKRAGGKMWPRGKPSASPHIHFFCPIPCMKLVLRRRAWGMPETEVPEQHEQQHKPPPCVHA